MRFYALEKLINLHDNYRGLFKIDHLRLLLLQRGNERYLIEASCPHRAHPLELADVEGGVLQCPLHQYRFDLKDGALLYHSEEPCRKLRTWELHYEGNEVGVMLSIGEEL